MSFQERQNMKRIDELILGATPEELKRFQELDTETQLDGKSFYDTCAESAASQLPRTGKRRSGLS